MTITNVAKGDIAQNDGLQFILFPQCFHHYQIIIFYFIEIFHIFALMSLKSSAADLLDVGKGKIYSVSKTFTQSRMNLLSLIDDGIFCFQF